MTAYTEPGGGCSGSGCSGGPAPPAPPGDPTFAEPNPQPEPGPGGAQEWTHGDAVAGLTDFLTGIDVGMGMPNVLAPPGIFGPTPYRWQDPGGDPGKPTGECGKTECASVKGEGTFSYASSATGLPRKEEEFDSSMMIFVTYPPISKQAGIGFFADLAEAVAEADDELDDNKGGDAWTDPMWFDPELDDPCPIECPCGTPGPETTTWHVSGSTPIGAAGQHVQVTVRKTATRICRP